MKLWLISQTENEHYNIYDSAVVVALTAEDARMIQPGGPTEKWGDRPSTWCGEPSSVNVREIGEAIEGTEAGTVICASFNGG